jgi:hypothetical protein
VLIRVIRGSIRPTKTAVYISVKSTCVKVSLTRLYSPLNYPLKPLSLEGQRLDRITQKHAQNGLIIIAVWALLGVIYAGPTYYEMRSEGMDHAAWRVFSWGILTWLAWAPLTPVMVWIARRFSLVEGAWKRNLLVHLPAFFFVSILHSAAHTAITLTIQPWDDMGTSPQQFWTALTTRRASPMLLPFGLIAAATLTSGKSHTCRSRTFSK